MSQVTTSEVQTPQVVPTTASTKPKYTMAEKNAALQNTVLQHINTLGFELLTNISTITNQQQDIDVKCPANHVRKISVKPFLKWKECSLCHNDLEAMKYYNNLFPQFASLVENEQWAECMGMQVSSLGRVKDPSTNSLLVPHKKGSPVISINRRGYSIPSLIVRAFKLPGHQHIVDNIDGLCIATTINSHKPATIDNVRVSNRMEKFSEVNQEMKDNPKSYAIPIKEHPYVVLPEFPQWAIYRDGTIYNSQANKWVYGKSSRGTNRRYIETADGLVYDIAKLVVMAFKPPADHSTYADYQAKGTVIKFVDESDKTNCHVDNLQVVLNFVSKEKQMQALRAEKKDERFTKLHEDVNAFVASRKGTLVTPLDNITSVFTMFEYTCACNNNFKKCLKDLDLNAKCIQCIASIRYNVTVDASQDFYEKGNLYKKYEHGWIVAMVYFLTTSSTRYQSTNIE